MHGSSYSSMSTMSTATTNILYKVTNVSFIYSVLLPTSIKKLNFYLLNYQYNKEHQYNKKSCWVFGEGMFGEGTVSRSVYACCMTWSHENRNRNNEIMHRQNGDNDKTQV